MSTPSPDPPPPPRASDNPDDTRSQLLPTVTSQSLESRLAAASAAHRSSLETLGKASPRCSSPFSTSTTVRRRSTSLIHVNGNEVRRDLFFSFYSYIFRNGYVVVPPVGQQVRIALHLWRHFLLHLSYCTFFFSPRPPPRDESVLLLRDHQLMSPRHWSCNLSSTVGL